jgi:hypothetical protein
VFDPAAEYRARRVKGVAHKTQARIIEAPSRVRSYRSMLRMARTRYSRAHNSMQALEGNKGLSDVSASRNIRMFVDGHADGSPLDRPSHAGHRQEPCDGSPRWHLRGDRCLFAEVSRLFLVAHQGTRHSKRPTYCSSRLVSSE